MGITRSVQPVLAASVVLSVLALGACSSSGSSEPATSGGASNKTLTWAIPDAPASLDISKAINATSYTVQSAALDTLVHSENGKIVPWLAESFTTPNPTTYVFKLRTGVKFWNGDAMTAEDVAYSITRLAKPSALISYDFSSFKAATATGPNQVTVTLRTVDPLFLSGAIGTDAFIVQKKFVENAGNKIGDPTALTMGTGPYKVDSFSPTNGVSLSRNESFWGAKPAAAKLVFKIITDPESLRIALTQGQVDGTLDADASTAARYKSSSAVTATLTGGYSINLLSMDVRYAPFNDVHIRRAIAYATDKAAIIQGATNGTATEAFTPMTRPQLEATYGPDGAALKSQIQTHPFDLAKAKSEMAASSNPQGFTTTAKFRAQDSVTFQILQQNYKAIGINLTGKQEPDQQFYTETADLKNNQGFLVTGTGFTSTDPWETFRSLLSFTDNNTAGFASPTTTAALKELSTETDPAKRTAANTSIAKELASQVPWVPLYNSKKMLVLSKKWAWTFNGPRSSGWIMKVKSVG